jgi:hypothetical protein
MSYLSSNKEVMDNYSILKRQILQKNLTYMIKNILSIKYEKIRNYVSIKHYAGNVRYAI